MLHEVVDDADDPGDPESLASALASLLAETIDDVGMDRAVAETELDAAVLAAVVDGDEDPLAAITLEDAAALLALPDDRGADDVVFEIRDHLLMGMTTAVLDVDTLAAGVDADLTGQEIQQAIEGRATMTAAELAAIAAVIEDRKP